MTVVPVVVQATTGRPADAGLVTAFSSGATVCAELLMPSLLGRVRPGAVFGSALLLMGVGSLAHLWVELTLGTILTLAAVRGAGFGASVVSAAVLIAELAPAHARGRAVGTMGLVVGLASMVSPSVGLVILGSRGANWVFALTGLVALFGALVVMGVDRGLPRPTVRTVQVHRALTRPDLLVPVLGLALLTATYGGLVSFAPRILDPTGLASAASFFFAFGAARTVARWLGGAATDRVGARRMVLLGLICACVGIGLLALSTSAAAVIASGLLYGGGSGVAQSGSFVGMLERVHADEVRLVGTVWNLAFDGGVSLGGVILGVVAATGGYASVLLAMPLLTFSSLLVFTFGWRAPVRHRVSTHS